MFKLLDIALAAAICTASLTAAAMAADHREAPMIREDITADIADIYNRRQKDALATPPEHGAIDTWRKTRFRTIRPPVVRVPSGQSQNIRPR